MTVLVLNFTQNYKIEIKVRRVDESAVEKTENLTQQVYTPEPRPKYWFYMARGYMWIFFSVDNVLRRLGLEKIEINVNMHEMVHMDWDLLWTYDYQNEIPINFKKLKYNQKINHIPGNFVLCMKENLAMNTDSKYIPKAFNNSEDILKYAEKHPEARFVQKYWSNRGVKLKKAAEINFSLFAAGNKYFAQLYIENPLLIDGYKFDFGVYVLVTSIDPLRIYYYAKNTLVRMCEKKYNPNNYEDIDSYVISDACLFPWDVDALSVYYNNSYNYKESMNAYFRKQGIETDRIWSQVEDCIRSIVLSKEHSYIYWVHWLFYLECFDEGFSFQTKKHPFKHSFFELYRFDFILDRDLNLNLIEVNQSPNVNPSAKLHRDQRMFESLLYDSFNLLGFGHYLKKKSFELGWVINELKKNCWNIIVGPVTMSKNKWFVTQRTWT